jgi:hypothetical protein
MFSSMTRSIILIRSVEGDWEGEEPVHDLGPPGRHEVQSASTRLPLGCGEAGPAPN